MYKSKITFNNNFKYSINLNMDLHNIDKVNNYIATNTSVELLSEFIKAVDKENAKPLLFVGPYGKGKSHLLLVLAELLYSKNFNSFKKLVNELGHINTSFSKVIKKIKAKRYLPIVLNGSYDAFKSELILELKRRLADEGIHDFDYKTTYDVAIELIDAWVLDTYAMERISVYTEKQDYNIKELTKELQSLSKEGLNKFRLLYKYMMYGLDFEPLINQNVANIVREVSSYLAEKTKFDGLILIMDEFGKMLEGDTASEVYGDIQNLAEATASSPFRMICVTHKRIGDYTYRLEPDKVNEWRKIEGRFDSLFFGLFEDQSYYFRLIEKAIIKDKVDESPLLDKSSKIYNSFSYAFDKHYIDEELVVKGAFPLNAYTVYGLTRLSERIAQNERSLFTFLCSEQKYGLRYLVNKSDEDLIGIDALYDYFKNIIEENKLGNAYKTYIKAKTLLSVLTNDVHKQIIKALAIIHIISDRDVLSPTIQTLSRALNNCDIETEVEELTSKGLILKKARTNNITFLSGTGIDIQSDINKIIELYFKNTSFVDAYDKLFNNKYIIPKQYNYDKAMTRYFKVKFINEEIILKKDFILEHYIEDDLADGHIVYVIPKLNSNGEGIAKRLREFDSDTTVFCVKNIGQEISDLVRHLFAVTRILSAKKKNYDDYIYTELEMLRREYEYDLDEYINELLLPDSGTYIYRGETLQGITDMASLSRGISKICSTIYKDTPRINYELINKNNVSSPVKKARRYCLEKIFDSNYDMGNLRDTSPEKTMFKALIETNHLDKIDRTLINKESNSEFYRVLHVIKSFFDTADQDTKISKLYRILQKPPYGIRKGVIPIFLALYLAEYRQHTIVNMNGKELSLELQYIEFMDEQPENFSIYIVEDNEEANNYIKELMDIFSAQEVSNLSIYEATVRPMVKYTLALPYCCKNISYEFHNGQYKKIDGKIVAIRGELSKFNINAKTLLIDKIPKKYFNESSFNEIINYFREYKQLYDNYLYDMKKYIEWKIGSLLNLDTREELKDSLSQWKNSIDNNKLKYIDNQKFLKLYSMIDHPKLSGEVAIAEGIASLMTDASIEDWNDDSIGIFEKTLAEVNDVFESLDSIEKKVYKNKISIELNGYQSEKYFSNVDITEDIEGAMGEIKAIINDYGLHDKDQQALLMNLLKDYLEGAL